jgi:drug/metabolite transporter (DMT)-like permease
MIAFAGNSLLCRLALKQTSIDAASFTFIRIISGAIALCLIKPIGTTLSRRSSAGADHFSPVGGGNWTSAFALFAYAAGFSFAYVSLSAGTGALILFGAVQATMMLWGLRQGERFGAIQIIGLVVALLGLVVLVFPGLSAPPLTGVLLMFTSGVAWGIYSLRGKGVIDPIAATTGNFLRAVPFALVSSIASIAWARVDHVGMGCAVLSGAITSGFGYVIWYRALSGLKAASAATVQLSVPVLAATGGILILGEPITLRYLFAAVAVLGGIALVVLEKQPCRH